MRRDLALVAVFAIFVFSIANPLAYVDNRTRGNEHQEAMFSTAADGAESSESITSFSETTDDDVLFYPDLFICDTPTLASAGAMGGSADNEIDDYTETWYYDSTVWGIWDDTTNDWDFWADLNFSLVVSSVESLTFSTNTYAWYAGGNPGSYTETSRDITFYNGTGWEDIGNIPTGWAWRNITILEPYITDDNVFMTRMRYVANTTGNTYATIQYDYAEVVYSSMTLADSDHYAEGFNDVSDWTTSDTSISSDGDLATITENGAGSTGRAYASFSSTDHFEHYYEFRIYSMTATTANLEFWDGAAYNTLKTFTAAGTYKGIISDTDAATMQRIGFLVGSEGGNIKPDYLRIGPATEMGWQHDGSTTAGFEQYGTGYTYSSSSDGDVFTGNCTYSSSDRWAGVSLYQDTTATKARISRDDYQFLEVRIRMNWTGSPSRGIWFQYDGYGVSYAFTDVHNGVWQTVCRNVKAATTVRDFDYIYFYALLYSGHTITYEIDYAKIYSIANFTVTQSGATTDDYLYVDSGVLYSNIDDGYIELNHDPALTVNTATYNVWNLTTSGTSPEFDNYVGSWAGYSSETRGSLSSGTLTDLRLKFDSIESISAITFIEDGTAPDADIVVSPDPPDDDEQVTLSSIVFDDVEVYKVWYNAISYPAGFSDVDYEATEGQENYWSYSFSSLIAGDYCFKVIANDGANNSTVTQANRDYATARFTVREAAIRLDPINQEGAEPDATHYQVSFVCNKDGDWSVTEWTQTDGSDAAETHTGVVVEGWNNIAWEKLDTDSSVVYFNMTVTNSTLTKTVPGLYLVAQTTFYVDASTTEGLDTVTVTGRITKLGNYLLYDENNELKDSGSITDLDFTIRFTKWSGYDEQDHDFAIKFTNGTQTCWYNSSYYAFKKPVATAVITTDKNALYAFQASFWTAIMILFVLGMVGVDFYRRYK